jgi:glycosyltransferase involved in cell wall biosynthesis
MREQWQIPSNAKVAGVVARLDQLKGQADAIAAFGRLATEMTNLHLVLVGGGWYEQTLRQQVDQLDTPLRSRVHFAGLLPAQQMAAAYAALDLKLLPSYQEGQSLTLAEALLTGTAIAAYDIGGMPEICIDQKTGRLIPAHNIKALAEATRDLLNDETGSAKLIEQGRQHVLSHFTVEQMVASYERVYHQLLMPIGAEES